MGILRKLADKFDPPETRSKDVSWDSLSMNTHGGYVPGWSAENLSTVLACVNAISTGCASLPAEVQIKRQGGGWETDEQHPLSTLIHEGCNPYQSWPDFMEWLLASVLLSGNGLAEIVRDQFARVRELRPIPWNSVSVQQLRHGRLVYDVTDQGVWGSNGRSRRLLQGEVFHLKDRSDDGLIGRSRLHRAAGTLRPALDLQTFTGALWRNGMHPSGAVELEGTLDPDNRKNLRTQLTAGFSGPSNAAKLLILDQGLKWKSINISPEDAELLQSRRFSTEELARIFNVPPPVIGDLTHGSFTNSETMLRWFAMGTLSPWITKIEHEVNRSIFSATERRHYRIDLDLSGLLRGDPETRWASHKIAVESGILEINEVREVEGWGPRKGGAPALA